jgi:hypothetical protein
MWHHRAEDRNIHEGGKVNEAARWSSCSCGNQSLGAFRLRSGRDVEEREEQRERVGKGAAGM